MKKFILLMALLLIGSPAFATLTANIIPVAASGGSTPTLKNSDITDVVGVSVTSSVPITATSFTGLGASLIQIANVSPNAVANFTISGLSPATRYLLILNLQQSNSNSYLTINFNADSGGSDYTYTRLQYTSTANYSYTQSTGAIDTEGNQNGFIQSVVYFQTATGNNDDVLVNEFGHGANGVTAGAGLLSSQTEGEYFGSAALSSIKITTNAGTVTGNAVLYQLN